MGLFSFFEEHKELKETNKRLMSDALRHKSSLGGKAMAERKQKLKKSKSNKRRQCNWHTERLHTWIRAIVIRII